MALSSNVTPLRPPLVERPRSIGMFLLVSFVWTWAFELIARSQLAPPHVIDNAGPLLVVASFGPFIGALSAVIMEHGLSGVRLLLRRFLPIGGNCRAWLMAAYVLVPAAMVSLVVFSDGHVGRALREGALLAFVPIIGVFSVVTGPLGEEFGWRGVLLPHVLSRSTPLVAAIVVGLIWGVWHLPLWTFNGFVTGLPAATFVPLYLVSLVAMSVIMTVLHLRSTGSVAVAMLAHGVLNSVLLPFDALRDDGLLATASAWPFTLAVASTAIVVGVLYRRVLFHRAQ
jgi:uncharacterized protein